LLRYDGFTLHTFSVMVMIAYLAGAAFIRRDARAHGIDAEAVSRVSVAALFAVILGGRLGYLVFVRRDLLLTWEALKVWHGGLVLYGGLLAVLFVVIAGALIERIRILQLTDLFAVGGMLGLAIGRWGCFFAGDDYGKPTQLPWGVRFVHPDTLVPFELRGIPLHPTQIYLSINALLIFGVLVLLRRRRPPEGTLTAALLMLYAVGRSFVEFFRGDPDRGFVGPLSTSQFISIFVFLGGAALLAAVRRIRIHSAA
jgi:phosphatidylglycerol:prolipoprotein diacylglycerol transferase